MKIIFMGTPDFAVPSLEALYKEGHSIELVVTQKDRPRDRGKKTRFTPVKEYAQSIDLKVYQPDNINSTEAIDLIRDIKPDFIVVIAFGQILKKGILNLPKYGCINVHASLLPKYRGAAPINWAIINGEAKTGISIMEMEEGLDSGPVYSSQSLKISKDDDYISVHNKLAKIGADLLVNTMDAIIKNEITKQEQDHSLASYASKIYKEQGRIFWDKTGLDIYNLIKGLKPWPGTYTKYKDEIIKIHDIDILPKENEGELGEIIRVSNEGIYVNTIDSTIVIKALQFPNKRKMEVKEYLAGNRIEVGVVLE